MIRVAWRQTPESDESWREAYRRLVGEPWRKRDVDAMASARSVRVILMKNGVRLVRSKGVWEIQFPHGWTFGLKSLEGVR